MGEPDELWAKRIDCWLPTRCARLFEVAADDCIFMHCLPAYDAKTDVGLREPKSSA